MIQTKQGAWVRTVLALGLLFFTFAAQASLPIQDSQGQKLPSLAPMLDRTIPAVVNVASSGKVKVRQNPLFEDPFFRRFFDIPDQPQERRTQSLGSGVIVDAEHGYILTNNHVIEHADEIDVLLHDGRHYSAKLIGTDPDTDIAVIKVDAKNLQQVSMGNSDNLNVGDFVVAIGNPFGLGQTVTSGIVSALGRSNLGIEGYEDFIQTDASINPGNSGGALVNLNGQLVGVNTAIFSQSGGNIGIGFAIPINMARSVMEQLIKYGEVKRGHLGAQVQNLTPDLAEAFAIKHKHGAVVTQVTPGSAAEKAGLKSGDVMVEVNGKPIKEAADVRNAIGLLRVGDEVSLTVLRDGKKRELTAVVAETSAKDTAQGKKLHERLAGASFSNIEPGMPMYGKIKGVLIGDVEQGSPAWRAGLRKGDIITSVNRKEVTNIDELRAAMDHSDKLLLNIRRGNGALFLYLQ
jgi:serine protease Do/serine protease DegQ